jgi:hypothetical protein
MIVQCATAKASIAHGDFEYILDKFVNWKLGRDLVATSQASVSNRSLRFV